MFFWLWLWIEKSIIIQINPTRLWFIYKIDMIMKKILYLNLIFGALSLCSCSDNKKEKQNPHEEIEAASDSIPTDGAELGKYVNEKAGDADSLQSDSVHYELSN